MSAARYTPVAAILHWAIAALIIGQIFGGMYMHGLPNSSPIKFDLYQLHKSFGLSVLVLSLFRLGWRLSHKAPPLPDTIPDWQKIIARATHWAFYALMILTPLAGWAIVSVSPTDIPTKWFGVIPVPHLPFFGGVADREAVEHLMEERHELLAKIILVLLVLHVGAALKHLFVDKDGVFQSMIPERKRSWMGLGAIVAVLGAGVAFYYVSPKPGVAAPAHSHHEAGAHEADGGNWVVDYAASSLRFIGSEKGKQFVGVFNDFTAVIDFDPDNLADGSIEVTVRTSSAATGDSMRDSNMPGAEWFNVKEYPEAVFASSDIRAEGDDLYEATGSLTIKNYEKPVTLRFALDIDGDKAVATGGADLVRTDFGLGENTAWLEEEGVAAEVRVEFEIHATRKD